MRKRVRDFGMDSTGSEWGPVVGCFEHGNEPWGSIKGANFVTNWATVSLSRRLWCMELFGIATCV